MSMLWGGRFSGSPDALMRVFQDSIRFDNRLWAADIRGSIAYAKALAQGGIITLAERDAILAGMAQIHAEFETGQFALQPNDEDIHTAVERRLKELIGEPAGKLHTGRSRNDQVATDTRLWLKAEIPALTASLRRCLQAIISQAQTHLDVLMPGYTHLQQAQPIRFSHWLLSYGWMLARDLDRLEQVNRHADSLPLGSGAMAGNPIGLDQAFLAAELGFANICPNSMDAVSDRDYIVEFLSWAALTQTHLSKLAEDLIIYSSTEFGYVELADAYSTGSSIMPQKKNPDSMELMRGKTGRLIGHLTGLLTTLKGTPATYNKDFQEDKEPLFDTVDTMAMTLPIMAGAIETLTVNKTRMYNGMSSLLLATELAHYLVSKGLPFRQAHEMVGKVVQLSLSLDQPLWSMPLAAYQSVSAHFERDVHQWLDFERAVERYNSLGGPARASVQAQISALQEKIKPL